MLVLQKLKGTHNLSVINACNCLFNISVFAEGYFIIKAASVEVIIIYVCGRESAGGTLPYLTTFKVYI